MICVTCQWLWENLDRPGEKFVQGNWLAEEDTRFQKKKKKIIILCCSHDGHRIGENGQAEFGNVARLSIFLRMI